MECFFGSVCRKYDRKSEFSTWEVKGDPHHVSPRKRMTKGRGQNKNGVVQRLLRPVICCGGRTPSIGITHGMVCLEEAS